MRGLGMATRGALACLAAVALAGCENRLPTASGADLFPDGTTPTTLELVVPAGDFVLGDTVYDGFHELTDASYLLVANRFDGGLDAHALARLTGFPDSVTYSSGGTSRTEKEFVYTAGRVVTRVDSTASQPRSPVTLRLWELAQPFDSATVTWQHASRQGGGVAWQTPGGTFARLLAEGRWVPGDTVSKDSVVFRLDSLTVRRLAGRNAPGIAVTSATSNSRLQIGQLVLETGVRPAGKPDTVLTQRIGTGPQTFVFNPDVPRTGRTLRAGGPFGQRTVLRLDLNQRVPACASPATTPNCPRVRLRDVTLNRAILLLDPVPVTMGFRPISTRPLSLRRVVEPELGRRAPLGEVLAQDTAEAALFRAPGGRPLSLNLTSLLLSGGADSTAVTVALTADAATAEFGSYWFASAPRLRLVYTLPLRPRLP